MAQSTGSRMSAMYRRKAAAAAAARKPAPPPVAPPGTAVNPAGDPDAWMRVLLNDPTYVSDVANLTAENAAARAKRDAAVKALMFQYNDPSNPYATVAQLARQEASDRANMTGDRAARGVLASGGTKLQTQDIGYNYGKSLYDALNNVTGQIGSLDQGLADTEHSNMIQQQQALASAAQSLIDAGYAPSVVQAAVKATVGSGAAGGGGGVGTWSPTPGGGRVATNSVDAQGRSVALPGPFKPPAPIASRVPVGGYPVQKYTGSGVAGGVPWQILGNRSGIASNGNVPIGAIVPGSNVRGEGSRSGLGLLTGGMWSPGAGAGQFATFAPTKRKF